MGNTFRVSGQPCLESLHLVNFFANLELKREHFAIFLKKVARA